METRQEQLALAIEFIKTKGPFLEGEVILFSGDFNTDALMGEEQQAGGTFYPKLNDAVTYPTLAARKDDILNQYDKMLEILADEGNFLVVDTYWEKNEKHYPTFGRCEFKKGVWTPLETFFTSSTSSCSN